MGNPFQEILETHGDIGVNRQKITQKNINEFKQKMLIRFFIKFSFQ